MIRRAEPARSGMSSAGVKLLNRSWTLSRGGIASGCSKLTAVLIAGRAIRSNWVPSGIRLRVQTVMLGLLGVDWKKNRGSSMTIARVLKLPKKLLGMLGGRNGATRAASGIPDSTAALNLLK